MEVANLNPSIFVNEAYPFTSVCNDVFHPSQRNQKGLPSPLLIAKPLPKACECINSSFLTLLTPSTSFSFFSRPNPNRLRAGRTQKSFQVFRYYRGTVMPAVCHQMAVHC